MNSRIAAVDVGNDVKTIFGRLELYNNIYQMSLQKT